MSDQRSIHPQFLTSKQPDAKDTDGPKCPIIRYYPGRCVSVQFGLLPPNNNAFPETRARIILRFDVGAVGELAGLPMLDDPRFERLQGPAVFVLAADEAAMADALTNEQTVTLFVEARFLRETASSEVAGVTVGDLVELGRKDALSALLVDVLRTLFQRPERPNSQYVEALGTVMAVRVLQHFFDGEAPADRRSGLPEASLQRVVAYVDEHYAEEFDVVALARASGFSRNHFQRLFKKSLNQTARTYVRDCQVKHAIKLLQTTTMKGLDIALACGFCDETQMARWFVKLRGCLPGQVRGAAR